MKENTAISLIYCQLNYKYIVSRIDDGIKEKGVDEIGSPIIVTSISPLNDVLVLYKGKSIVLNPDEAKRLLVSR